MGMYAQYPNKQEMINSLMSDKTYGAFFGGSGYENPTGKAIYYRLEILFKSQKAASLFLMQCGFDGISYPERKVHSSRLYHGLLVLYWHAVLFFLVSLEKTSVGQVMLD